MSHSQFLYFNTNKFKRAWLISLTQAYNTGRINQVTKWRSVTSFNKKLKKNEKKKQFFSKQNLKKIKKKNNYFKNKN